MTMIAPGELIAGKYAVECELGRGGEAIVVAANDTVSGQRVALKLPRRDVAQDREAVGRFAREARILEQIRSEHVLRLLEARLFGAEQPFLVVEHLEGSDLAAVVARRGNLTVTEACDYLGQACVGLAAAHAHGIIHRDLKPSNLFLTSPGCDAPLVKVIDFGFAELRGVASHPAAGSFLRGSPAFMPPEQLRAECAADVRGDIWALGTVLFTLLTGSSPFQRRYLTDTCQAVLSGDIPELGALRAVPHDLAAVIQRCLAVEPDQRFSSVAELCFAIAPFAGARAWDRAERARLQLMAPGERRRSGRVTDFAEQRVRRARAARLRICEQVGEEAFR